MSNVLQCSFCIALSTCDSALLCGNSSLLAFPKGFDGPGRVKIRTIRKTSVTLGFGELR